METNDGVRIGRVKQVRKLAVQRPEPSPVLFMAALQSGIPAVPAVVGVVALNQCPSLWIDFADDLMRIGATLGITDKVATGDEQPSIG